MAIDRTNTHPAPDTARNAEPQGTGTPSPSATSNEEVLSEQLRSDSVAQARSAELAATHTVLQHDRVNEAQAHSAVRDQTTEALLQQAGFSRGPDGQLSPTDVATVPSAEELALQIAKDKALQGPLPELGKPMAPPVAVQSDSAAQAATFATNFQSALAMTALEPGNKTVDISQLSADVLLSAFMKLTILDPADSEKAKNDMAEMISLLNQQGIREAQQRLENQAQQAKEARQEAAMMEFVQVLAVAITVVLVVVLVVAAIFTAGTTLLLLAALLTAVVGIMGAMAASQKQAEAEKNAALAESAATRIASSMVERNNSPEKSLERMLERLAAEEREELRRQTLLGPDGKPIANAGGLLKSALMVAMGEIMNIANTQGVDVALREAGPLVRNAMAKKLREMGVEPPDEIADAISKEAIAKLRHDTFADLGMSAAAIGEEQGADAMGAYLEQVGLPAPEAQQVASAVLSNPETAAQVTAGVLAGRGEGTSISQALMLSQTFARAPEDVNTIGHMLAREAGNMPAGTRGAAVSMLTSLLGQGQGLAPANTATFATPKVTSDINTILRQIISSQAAASDVIGNWADDSQRIRAAQQQGQLS